MIEESELVINVKGNVQARTKKGCGCCKYSIIDNEYDGMLCRRYPNYTCVHQHYWCGEFTRATYTTK